MLSCPHFIGTVLDLFANDDENLSYCHIRYTTLKKSVGISNALQASVCGKCNRYLIKIAFFFIWESHQQQPYIHRVIRAKKILLTNSTGSAFKQLVSVALGAGGMTQDTLVLQHKLATRTGRRGFTSSKSNAEDQENDKRDGRPHGCARGLSVESEKDGKQWGLSPKTQCPCGR